MTNLQRLTGKIFGETATATGDDPQIGQFGSALNGTYVGTTDVATIQSLPAWSNGFIDSVTPNEQFPPLPEMTGFGKVLSYQTAYTLQKGVPEWDSGTTYYTGDFCKGVGEGKLYVSKIDSNINNDLTDTNSWEEFSSGSSRSIGEIVTSTIPLTDAGLHLLDGALLQYGSYQEFVDYIADLYDSGDYTDIFETEANWQSAVTTYGVCGKLVYDSTNNTVRLPKITGFIEGTTDLTALGDLVEAGLPNITGSMYATISGGSNVGAIFNSGSGAISTTTSGTVKGAQMGSNYARTVVSINASNSNSIYGNSNTVQPQTIKVLYYIVIATSTKTDIQVDIDEIATDLNGKADVDLTNVNNSGTSRGAGWAMPSGTYIDLTLGASGATYTAPANGYVYFQCRPSYNGGGFSLDALDSSNNSLVKEMQKTTANSVVGGTIPVLKNQTFRIYYDSATDSLIRFIYANGSESEAS